MLGQQQELMSPSVALQRAVSYVRGQGDTARYKDGTKFVLSTHPQLIKRRNL